MSRIVLVSTREMQVIDILTDKPNMPQLTFHNARSTNPDRHGTDVIFSYTVDNETVERIFYAVGNKFFLPNEFGESNSEFKEYKQVMFAGVIDFIERYWHENLELPKDNIVIQEWSDGRGLRLHDGTKLSWEGYILELSLQS